MLCHGGWGLALGFGLCVETSCLIQLHPARGRLQAWELEQEWSSSMKVSEQSDTLSVMTALGLEPF